LNNVAKCRVKGFLRASAVQHIKFRLGDELQLGVVGETGPAGISDVAADLLDLASVVFQIEKHLTGRQRTNPAKSFELDLPVRRVRAWNKSAIAAAEQALAFLGNAEWQIAVRPARQLAIPPHFAGTGTAEQVVLLSGGMDSACGVATLRKAKSRSAIVSFYTRQGALQIEIAKKLGARDPLQFHWVRHPGRGRGHSSYYRSFLFLCLAAVSAHSWRACRVLQYENGVLGSAIPPIPAFRMTKHAHPKFHLLMSTLFGALFGDEWHVADPFIGKTKRGCFDAAANTLGRKQAISLLRKTESCWFKWQNRIPGGQKSPGTPCGVCVPCIVQRTAFEHIEYAYDVSQDAVRNSARLGNVFRAYHDLASHVLRTRGAPYEFYRWLPSAGRELVAPVGAIPLGALHDLFLTFADEFRETYL